MMVTFPNMGVAIIWKRTDTASGGQALKDSALVYAPLRGTAVS